MNLNHSVFKRGVMLLDTAESYGPFDNEKFVDEVPEACRLGRPLLGN